MANIVTVSKIGGGLLVGGGLIGGGVFYSMRSNAPVSAIEKSLNTKGKKLLASNRQDLWEIKLYIYKNRLSDTENINLSSETWQGLQSWCEAQTKSWTEDTKVIEQAIKICTVPNLEEKLDQIGKVLPDSDDWAEKFKKYQQEKESNKIIPTLNQQNSTADNLKDWCWKTFQNEYEDDTKNDYPLTLNWCVN